MPKWGEVPGIFNRKECVNQRLRTVFICNVLPVVGSDLRQKMTAAVVDVDCSPHRRSPSYPVWVFLPGVLPQTAGRSILPRNMPQRTAPGIKPESASRASSVYIDGASALSFCLYSVYFRIVLLSFFSAPLSFPILPQYDGFSLNVKNGL